MATLLSSSLDRPDVVEQRFRRALRWYPQAWRALHGDAMLGVMLDVAQAGGLERPTPGLRLNLARHGLAARIAGRFPPRVRDFAATSAFIGGTAFTLFHLAFFAWAPWATHAQLGSDLSISPPLPELTAWPEIVWLVAAACQVIGWRRTARALIALAAVSTMVLVLGRYGHPSWIWPRATTLAVLLIPAMFVLGGKIRAQSRTSATLTILSLAAAFTALDRLRHPGSPLVSDWRESDAALWFVPYAHNERTIVLLVPVAFVVLALSFLAFRRHNAAVVLVACGLPWALVWSAHGLHDSIFGTAGTLGPLGVTGERLVFAGITAMALLALAAAWARLHENLLAHG